MIGQQDATCWAVQPQANTDEAVWVLYATGKRQGQWPAQRATCYTLEELFDAMQEHGKGKVLQ